MCHWQKSFVRIQARQARQQASKMFLLRLDRLWRKEAHMEPLNVFEYEVLARERMDPVYWDFYAGGSDEEVTLRANQADFARIHLRSRMLVDVTRCDTSTSVLGLPVPMPILVAPTSMHCLAHPEGECATAQGAGAAGTLMIASTDATRSLECDPITNVLM